MEKQDETKQGRTKHRCCVCGGEAWLKTAILPEGVKALCLECGEKK